MDRDKSIRCTALHLFWSSGDTRRLDNFNFDTLEEIRKEKPDLLNFRPIYIPAYNVDSVCGYAGGGFNHRFLSKIGYKFIKDKYNGEPLFEQWYSGKRVDLYCDRSKTVLECGDTDPHHLIKHLTHINRAIVIPFQERFFEKDVFIDKQNTFFAVLITTSDRVQLKNFFDRQLFQIIYAKTGPKK